MEALTSPNTTEASTAKNFLWLGTVNKPSLAEEEVNAPMNITLALYAQACHKAKINI